MLITVLGFVLLMLACGLQIYRVIDRMKTEHQAQIAKQAADHQQRLDTHQDEHRRHVHQIERQFHRVQFPIPPNAGVQVKKMIQAINAMGPHLKRSR